MTGMMAAELQNKIMLSTIRATVGERTQNMRVASDDAKDLFDALLMTQIFSDFPDTFTKNGVDHSSEFAVRDPAFARMTPPSSIC